METNCKHLSCKERTIIQLSLEQGCSLRVIARSLQQAPSPISRELKRNGWTNPTTGPQKRGRPPLAGGYGAPLAQQLVAGLAKQIGNLSSLTHPHNTPYPPLVKHQLALTPTQPLSWSQRLHFFYF